MAKYTLNLTGSSDNQVLINQAKATTEGVNFGCTVFASGTFSGATATIQISPDGGTTKFTVKDVNGNDAAFTAAGYTNFVTGIGNKTSDYIKVYALLSGGDSNTSVTLTAFDTIR